VFRLIFILLVLVPIVEVALFIKIGGFIGLWPTLGAIVLTAVAGAALLRRQGLQALRNLQQALDANRLPVAEAFDGACLLVAGVLLLTPGFFTDALGFLLFVPPVRTWLRRRLGDFLMARGDVHVDARTSAAGPGTVIEGEFQEIAPEKPAPPDGPSREP
jgi:UPF0716 protein FxsA